MGRLIRLGLVLFCMSLSSCDAIEFFIEDRAPVLEQVAFDQSRIWFVRSGEL